MRQQASVNALENYSQRPENTVSTSVGWDYKTVGFGDIPDYNEFTAPPLRPSTIFANSKTADKIRFPPGGFKTFKTQFRYDGTLFKLCRDVTQVMYSHDGSDAANGKYPSIGDSFIMCLMPTIKTKDDEKVRVAFDFVTDGKVHCTKFKGGSLPTTNMVE